MMMGQAFRFLVVIVLALLFPRCRGAAGKQNTDSRAWSERSLQANTAFWRYVLTVVGTRGNDNACPTPTPVVTISSASGLEVVDLDNAVCEPGNDPDTIVCVCTESSTVVFDVFQLINPDTMEFIPGSFLNVTMESPANSTITCPGETLAQGFSLGLLCPEAMALDYSVHSSCSPPDAFRIQDSIPLCISVCGGDTCAEQGLEPVSTEVPVSTEEFDSGCLWVTNNSTDSPTLSPSIDNTNSTMDSPTALPTESPVVDSSANMTTESPMSAPTGSPIMASASTRSPVMMPPTAASPTSSASIRDQVSTTVMCFGLYVLVSCLL